MEQRGLAITKIDDPYGVDLPGAALELPQGRQPSEAVREWRPPQPRKLVVVRRIADDPVAALFARRQINKSAFAAARDYQRAYEIAAGHGMQSPPLEFTPPSTSTARTPISDSSVAAAKRIRHWDGRLGLRFGLEGVALLRHIVIHGRTLKELVADERGARVLGTQFRKILRELAVLTGHATAGRRQPYLLDRFVIVAIGIAARVAVREAAE